MSNNNLFFAEDNLLKNPQIKPYNKVKLESVVIQFCYNDVIKDKLALLPVYKTLMLLSGQKPKVLKAKDSIAAFKVRKNMEIGALVTLRGPAKLNFLNLFFCNLPKFNISNYKVSCKNFDLFYPIDNRTGASVYFNVNNNTFSKDFYLSSLLIFK
jgi:ribosomal protein L5